MTIENIINAWRDDEFRENMLASSDSMLPANPAGQVDLSDTDLEQISGSEEATTTLCITIGFSAIYCASIFAGGSCLNDTSGCCPVSVAPAE